MTTALVLGGGGSRGIAHIGVLKALEEKNITPDIIIGTSAGSMIGALYAYHPDVKTLEDIISNTQKKALFTKRLNVIQGVSDGDGISKFIDQHTKSATFKETKIPLLTVCLDLYSGEVVVIDEGPLAIAVQCSCALPPLFQPVNYKNRTLVDGGAVSPVAAHIARERKFDTVIAVNVGIDLPMKSPKTALGIMARYNLMRNRELDRRTAAEADIIIRPQIPGADILDDSDKPALIEAGYRAAMEQLK
jgi:NTE family protein